MKPIIFVAGLGRCGTSLTMQMLHRAGIPCTGRWPAFEPDEIGHGYGANARAAWLATIPGHAVKWLDPHIVAMPTTAQAVVIWLDRDWKEQAKSQVKMAKDQDATRHEWRSMMHIIRRDRSLALLPTLRFPRMFMTFERLILTPLGASTAIAAFLKQHDHAVDPEVMADAVLPRRIACQPDLAIELTLVGKVG
jgi:hypothetical protein